MASDDNNSANNNINNLSNLENEQSFVGKVRSHVADLLLNKNPLSKWFGSAAKSTVRKRQDVIAEYDDNKEEEEELTSILEPPTKRAKYPINQTAYNTYSESTNIYQSTPVTFNNLSEPVPGPSGIQQQQQQTRNNQFYNNEKLFNSVSGDGDDNKGGSDSEESTSGYSSTVRVESKEKIIENNDNYKTINRSLFNTSTDSSRNLFSQRSLLSNSSNTSLSKRRPNFNSSTFGTRDFLDSTLTTQRILNSPFYNGNTTFGGALTQKRKIGQTIKNSLKIQPINSNDKYVNNNEKLINNEITTLSKTARRILSTIEQYSTPISDAKKIPILTTKETTTTATTKNDGLLTKYIGYKPYLIENRRMNNKNQTILTNNKELQIPNLIQMKQKQRLQNSTEFIREITTKNLNNDKNQLNNKQNIYKLNDNTDNNKSKFITKMKNTKTLRQKLQLNDNNNLIEPVNLPKISLPITELPKFDLTSIPLIKNPNDNQINKIVSVEKKEENDNKKIIIRENIIIKDNDKTIEFKFSKPLVLTNENLKSIMPINDFKFSEPLNKKAINNNNNKMNGEIVSKILKPMSTTTTINKFVELSKNSTNADLKLFDKFKPAEDTWECNICLIRNKSDKVNCIACETPKIQKITSPLLSVNNNKSNTNVCSGYVTGISSSSSSDNTLLTTSRFDDKFKPSTDTWECQVCMIRNKNDANKCIACETPNNNRKKDVNSNNNNNNSLLLNVSRKCTKCLKEIKNELNKCDNCEKLSTINDNKLIDNKLTILNKFKPPDNLWKCETCLLMNKNELNKCIACEMPKLKQENNNKNQIINQWECPTCYVKNSVNNLSCVCCSHLRSLITPTKNDVLKNNNNNKISSFNFGIDKSGIDLNEQKNTIKSNVNFSFGNNNSTQLNNETFKPSTSTSIFSTPVSFGSMNNKEKTNEQETIISPKGGFKLNVNSTTKIPLTDNTNRTASNSFIQTTTTTTKSSIINSTTQSPTNITNNKLIESNSKLDKGNDLKIISQIKGNDNKTTTATNMTFNFVPMKPLNEENKNIFKFNSTSTLSVAATTTTITTTSPIILMPNPTILGETTIGQQNNSFNLLKDNNMTKIASNDVIISATANEKVDNKIFKFSNLSSPPPQQQSNNLPTFSFNQLDKSKQNQSVPPFKFGEKIGNASGGFNFTTNSTPTPMFNFNTNTNKSESTIFNNNQSSNNVFGTSLTSSTMKNGKTFNFGTTATTTTNNNQKAGFSFGAIAAQQDNNNQINLNNSSQQTGFNFSGNVATPSTGGFNFNSTLTQPAFNFTDGNLPTFSSQTAAGNGQQRKIRKALRRTTHR